LKSALFLTLVLRENVVISLSFIIFAHNP